MESRLHPGHSKPEDRLPLSKSLQLLGTLEPNLVLSSAFGGDSGFQEMREGEWPRHVNHALDLLHQMDAEQH